MPNKDQWTVPTLKKSNSKLVYSTDRGRIKEDTTPDSAPTGDGIIRIRRETKGRNGKGVTTLQGFNMDESELKTLAKKLKQVCGTGGTSKDGIVEIQGDQRDKLKSTLEGMGFKVKLAGG